MDYASLFPIEYAALPPGSVTSIPNNYPLYGSCTSQLAFTSVDAGFLQSLLPPGLELAPQSYTGPSEHPLLLMFNNTTLQFNDWLAKKASELKLDLKLDYNEFIVMLPYVQLKDPPPGAGGPYCFLPVLYLDSLLAVLGGKIFWEFNKILASFSISETQYEVNPLLIGAPYFTASFLPGSVGLPAAGVPNFVEIEPMLNLPVIEYGLYGYVSSVYKMNYQNQILTPAAITLTNNTCTYLPPNGMQIPPITNNVLGAFSINYDWELSYITFIKPKSI